MWAMSNLPFAATADVAAVPIDTVLQDEWSDYGRELTPQAQGFAAALNFSAQPGRWLSVPGPDGAIERVIFGVAQSLPALAHGVLASALPEGTYTLRRTPSEMNLELAALAWALGSYRFSRYRARRLPCPRLTPPQTVDMAEVERIARAVYLVRDLVNTPADDLGPAALHASAEEVANEHGAAFEAIVGDDLLTQNFPLIHAVGRAASQAPRLVKISWGDPSAPRITLVGKGVTFDSGGLDIKPSSGMRIMKKDMGGAAHALALGQMIMSAGLPVHLEVILAIVENAISGASMRPGDIFKSRKGLTVEIDNTDAEGRLILADALALACEGNPELLLDFATLTGAARTALGPDLPPLFTDDDDLAADLAVGSRAVADPIWRLPLWMAYDADLDSPIADIKNTGDAAMAGAIYGGLFLKRFVDIKSWAHFDVYAWAPKDRAARPTGGEAQAIRACWHVLRTRYPNRASHNI
jgi:leucyl aminopeptidase